MNHEKAKEAAAVYCETWPEAVYHRHDLEDFFTAGAKWATQPSPAPSGAPLSEDEELASVMYKSAEDRCVRLRAEIAALEHDLGVIVDSAKPVCDDWNLSCEDDNGKIRKLRDALEAMQKRGGKNPAPREGEGK